MKYRYKAPAKKPRPKKVVGESGEIHPRSQKPLAEIEKEWSRAIYASGKSFEEFDLDWRDRVKESVKESVSIAKAANVRSPQ